MNAALEAICAELSAQIDARWPRKPMPPPAAPAPAPVPEMSEESFRALMHYFGLDRGQIITIAGDQSA